MISVKKLLLPLAACIFCFSLPVHATGVSVTLNMSLDQLLTASSTPIPDGALIEILASTTSTFTAPSATDFVGGDPNEKVIAKISENATTSGTAGGEFTPVTFTLGISPVVTGDYLEVRWFPTLTTASTVPGAGTSYGQFRTDAVENGSDIAWVIPSAGTKTLNFLTTTAGGTEPNSAGVANLTTPAAVPEPATLLSLFSGMAAIAVVHRRRA